MGNFDLDSIRSELFDQAASRIFFLILLEMTFIFIFRLCFRRLILSEFFNIFIQFNGRFSLDLTNESISSKPSKLKNKTV
jgi:hypothetical protein